MHSHPGYLLLMILGALAFFLAVIDWKPVKEFKLNLVALGLLLWLMVPLLTLAQH